MLPVQEVVFVKVSDTSSDFTSHPLQLQQLSVSEHPILLRQMGPQVPLQTNTQSSLAPKQINIRRLHGWMTRNNTFKRKRQCTGTTTQGQHNPLLSSFPYYQLVMCEGNQIRVTRLNGPLCCVTEIYKLKKHTGQT